MILLPDSENCMIVASFVSTKHQNVTEDRRTDTAVAYTAVALQAVRTRCKNQTAVLIQCWSFIRTWSCIEEADDCVPDIHKRQMKQTVYFRLFFLSCCIWSASVKWLFAVRGLQSFIRRKSHRSPSLVMLLDTLPLSSYVMSFVYFTFAVCTQCWFDELQKSAWYLSVWFICCVHFEVEHHTFWPGSCFIMFDGLHILFSAVCKLNSMPPWFRFDGL